MTIKSVKESDRGEFSVVAENRFGSSTRDWGVYVKAKDTQPKTEEKKDVQNKTKTGVNYSDVISVSCDTDTTNETFASSVCDFEQTNKTLNRNIGGLKVLNLDESEIGEYSTDPIRQTKFTDNDNMF